jgi:hypothetical protein
LFIDGADLRLAPAVTDHLRDVSGARLVGIPHPTEFPFIPESLYRIFGTFWSIRGCVAYPTVFTKYLSEKFPISR